MNKMLWSLHLWKRKMSYKTLFKHLKENEIRLKISPRHSQFTWCNYENTVQDCSYRGYFTGGWSVSRKTLPQVLNVRTEPLFLLSFTSGKCMKNRRVNQECFYCGATCAKKLQEYHSNALTNVKNCQCHTKYGEVILKTHLMSRAVRNPAERSGS